MTERWTAAQYRTFVESAGSPTGLQPPTPRKVVQREHHEQVLLFALIDWLAEHHPDRADELEDVWATSSGGRRSPGEAGKMKASGQRKGVLDIEVMVPRDGFHALFIELKPERSGRASPEQSARIARLRARGYRAEVIHGWLPAATLLCSYLGIPFPSDPKARADMVLARRALQRRAARRARKRMEHA
jgi:hypothetical protein